MENLCVYVLWLVLTVLFIVTLIFIMKTNDVSSEADLK